MRTARRLGTPAVAAQPGEGEGRAVSPSREPEDGVRGRGRQEEAFPQRARREPARDFRVGRSGEVGNDEQQHPGALRRASGGEAELGRRSAAEQATAKSHQSWRSKAGSPRSRRGARGISPIAGFAKKTTKPAAPQTRPGRHVAPPRHAKARRSSRANPVAVATFDAAVHAVRSMPSSGAHASPWSWECAASSCAWEESASSLPADPRALASSSFVGFRLDDDRSDGARLQQGQRAARDRGRRRCSRAGYGGTSRRPPPSVAGEREGVTRYRGPRCAPPRSGRSRPRTRCEAEHPRRRGRRACDSRQRGKGLRRVALERRSYRVSRKGVGRGRRRRIGLPCHPQWPRAAAHPSARQVFKAMCRGVSIATWPDRSL